MWAAAFHFCCFLTWLDGSYCPQDKNLFQHWPPFPAFTCHSLAHSHWRRSTDDCKKQLSAPSHLLQAMTGRTQRWLHSLWRRPKWKEVREEPPDLQHLKLVLVSIRKLVRPLIYLSLIASSYSGWAVLLPNPGEIKSSGVFPMTLIPTQLNGKRGRTLKYPRERETTIP